jgi:uncharacterized membrane protein
MHIFPYFPMLCRNNMFLWWLVVWSAYVPCVKHQTIMYAWPDKIGDTYDYTVYSNVVILIIMGDIGDTRHI